MINWKVKNMSLKDGGHLGAAPDGHSIEGFVGVHSISILADAI